MIESEWQSIDPSFLVVILFVWGGNTPQLRVMIVKVLGELLDSVE